jgi:hypothetical protein
VTAYYSKEQLLNRLVLPLSTSAETNRSLQSEVLTLGVPDQRAPSC